MFFVAILALISAEPLQAAVQLASPFGDHMVLQQGLPVPVWGTAAPGEKITVEFAGQKKSVTADAKGQWRLDLDKLTASAQSRDFVVTSVDHESKTDNLKFTDVLVGEVWVCGGQSNMERQLGLRSGQKPIVNWEQEVAAATHPLIRQFYVIQHSALSPQAFTDGRWTVCSPATVADFTAVGYFFARDLQVKLGVPVGIIHSSIGGTPAEAWTSRDALLAFPEMKSIIEQVDLTAADRTAARQQYLDGLTQWYRDNDPGSGEYPWSVPDLDVSGWETMILPTLWEDAGHPDYDGVAWFRKSFDLPAGWAGRDLKLQLCGVDDIDTTWVNGVEVGRTSGYNLPRTYPVPATLLKTTSNVIAIRVLDTGGGGGIWEKTQPFALIPAEGSGADLPLAGPWLARFSRDISRGPRPPIDVTQQNSVPSTLYNAMIAPLIPYAIRGATFYQGEANADRPTLYRKLLPALIADWRQRWGQGDFPFLFVQIAPFKDQPPEIREAQLLAWKETKNTAMVVTIDIGDAKDIHPARKQPVGARLSLAARALAYGEKLEFSGPVFETMSVAGGHATLHFTHLGRGLVAKDGPLAGFTVAGADGVFRTAQAAIAGDTVVVSAPEVTQPAAVRYGWANVASGNLFNAAGLPASPFRTDIK
jgi:sialate O-acetylesterase